MKLPLVTHEVIVMIILKFIHTDHQTIVPIFLHINKSNVVELYNGRCHVKVKHLFNIINSKYSMQKNFLLQFLFIVLMFCILELTEAEMF